MPFHRYPRFKTKGADDKCFDAAKGAFEWGDSRGVVVAPQELTTDPLYRKIFGNATRAPMGGARPGGGP